MAVRARNKLELRRMRPDDLDEVMVIEKACFKHPWSTDLFRRELEHDPRWPGLKTRPGRADSPAAGSSRRCRR